MTFNFACREEWKCLVLIISQKKKITILLNFDVAEEEEENISQP